ncbi:UNVERIFIED_CONTAM: hypothetical protein Sradi_1768700 [Sesamum radiatum]|uniref:Uncharacterized protein n=1 Tax=Sesamum radiatum TaxID=300843 RepID=A0AAW2TTL7_SESRA
MENPSNTNNKQKAIETSGNIQALQVAIGTSLTAARRGSVPTPPPPGVVGPVTDPPRRSTSSNTSTDELSLAILGAIQRIVSAAIREQFVTLASPLTATPSDMGALEEEAEEGVPAHAPPTAGRRGAPSFIIQEVPPSGSRATSTLKKDLQDVKYQIEEAQKTNNKASPKLKR